jgi:peptide/nickel transport system substrate-binding protein
VDRNFGCDYTRKGEETVNRKLFLFASLLIVLSLVLASCATPTPEVVEKIVKEVVTEVVEVEKEVTRMVEGTPVVEQIVVTEVVEVEVTSVVEVEVETVVTATPAPMSDLATTLVIGVNGAPWIMDPVFSNDSWIDRQLVNMYDPLVNFAPVTGELVPWLAEEWDLSDDGLTYTFKIREGVKFHDGTDLTASDVKYSFDRMQALNEGVAFELTHFDSASVVDDYTVQLNMKVPSVPFTNSLPKFLIVSEDGAKAVEVDGDWGMGDADLGSGPYMIERIEPEQEYVYAKFDDYWQEWPEHHVDKIIWRIVKEAATQRLLLEKGDIDIAMEPAVEDLPALEDNPDINIYEDVSAQQMYFHLRMHHPPLDDVRVRKALALGYDYDAHIESILGGHGQQARGPLPRHRRSRTRR